jgi:uncharacterized protein YndB with AHSA1/START domain
VPHTSLTENPLLRHTIISNGLIRYTFFIEYNKNITMSQTTNSRVIRATVEKVFEAFSNAKALETWLAPSDMVGKVHNFNFSAGDGYTMSLFYPESEVNVQGKTADKEDRFTSRYIEIIPNKKIVEAVNFESDDTNFAGEMTMEVTFTPHKDDTEVTFHFKNIPKGIKPEDNEAGTISTLEKLARYVER